LTGNQAKVQVGSRTITELIAALEQAYPGNQDRLVDEGGEIKRFVNIFVNGAEIRTLQGAATALTDGDEVSIIPAMAGGASAQVCFCCNPMRACD